MFNETKSLIVVYKDELLLNQLRKLVETNDDTEDGVVGVKDGSVKIVSWNEKMWLGQKKNGTINTKVLFIGDIKETDKSMALCMDGQEIRQCLPVILKSLVPKSIRSF